MTKYWFALRTKPRKEDVVFRQMRSKEIEVFYPRLRVNPVNPRSKKFKPYFPGYMFIRVNLEETGMSHFRWMPHTLGIVTFGDEPATVPDHLIHSISKRVKEIAEAGGEVLDGLSQGDQVNIEAGPFTGYKAIFDTRIPGTERVRVLLEILSNQRQVPVELDVSQIQKKDDR